MKENIYQNNFFSKETISDLNKLLLQQSSLQNLSRDNKQEIINILVKNMKLVYKSMNTSKINDKNFSSIFEQFKKFSLTESINEISKSNIVSSQQSSADLKFIRDFNSNPNDGNKLMNRPQATKINNKHIENIPTNLTSYNQQQNNTNLTDNSNSKSNLYSLFE